MQESLTIFGGSSAERGGWLRVPGRRMKGKVKRSSMARNLPVENLLPQNVVDSECI